MRVAVIGCGHLGSAHAKALTRLVGVPLAAAVDLVPERAAATGAAAVFSSHHDLPGHVEAAIVATPTTTHAAIARDLLARGIHVLVEKPIAVTVEEAGSMVAAAGRSGRVLQVGHIERFNPAVVAAWKVLHEPLFIESHRLAAFVPRSLDVDVVRDLMIHDLDLVMDAIHAPLESVEAVGVPVLTGTADIANARLRFSNGAVANLTASRVSRDKVRKIRFFERNAYVSVDCLARKVEAYHLVPGEGPMGKRVEGGSLPVQDADALETELQAFLAAVRGEAPVAVTGDDGRRALEAALRIEAGVRESLERMTRPG